MWASIATRSSCETVRCCDPAMAFSASCWSGVIRIDVTITGSALDLLSCFVSTTRSIPRSVDVFLHEAANCEEKIRSRYVACPAKRPYGPPSDGGRGPAPEGDRC